MARITFSAYQRRYLARCFRNEPGQVHWISVLPDGQIGVGLDYGEMPMYVIPREEPQTSTDLPQAKGPIVGNQKSKKYHLPGCRILTATEHVQAFISEAAAVAAGFQPCGLCWSIPTPENEVPVEILIAFLDYFASHPVWEIVQARQDRSDDFGEPIQRGERRLVRSDSLYAYRAEVSLASARTMWRLLIADNRLTTIMLERIEETKANRLRAQADVDLSGVLPEALRQLIKEQTEQE